MSDTTPFGLDPRDTLTTEQHTARSTTGDTAIRGYKKLAPCQTNAVNQAKQMQLGLEEEIQEIRATLQESGEDMDGRWLSIALTQYQVAGMELIRAITKPDGF